MRRNRDGLSVLGLGLPAGARFFDLGGLAGGILGLAGGAIGAASGNKQQKRQLDFYQDAVRDQTMLNMLGAYGPSVLGNPDQTAAWQQLFQQRYRMALPTDKGTMARLEEMRGVAENQRRIGLRDYRKDTRALTGDLDALAKRIVADYDTGTGELTMRGGQAQQGVQQGYQNAINTASQYGADTNRLIDEDVDRAVREQGRAIEGQMAGRGLGNSTLVQGALASSRGELERTRARAKDDVGRTRATMVSGLQGQQAGAVGDFANANLERLGARLSGKTQLDAGMGMQGLQFRASRASGEQDLRTQLTSQLMQIMGQQAAVPGAVAAGQPPPQYIPQQDPWGSFANAMGNFGFGMMGQSGGLDWLNGIGQPKEKPKGIGTK